MAKAKRIILVRGSQAVRLRESASVLEAYRKYATRQSRAHVCDVDVVVEATGALIVSVKYEEPK